MSETASLRDTLYKKLVGEHPGSGAQEFIKHLGVIGFSFAAAKVISGVVAIAAGRLLGPEEYGRINVMASAGAAIAPFMLAGLQYSVVRYGVKPETRARVFGSALAAAASLTVLVAGLALLFRGALADIFHIDRGMLYFSLGYAAATAAFLLTSGMQQALSRFSRRGMGEIAFSLTLAGVFGLGLLYLGRVYEVMAWAYIAAFGGTAFFWLYRTLKEVKPAGFSGEAFSSMSEYGFYNFGASLGGVLLLNVQGLVVNAALTPAETGVYAAYYTAAINIGGYLAYALATVLFPKASAAPDRRRLWDLAVRGWLRAGPAVILIFVLVQCAVLSLMGRHQYGLDPLLIALFSVAGSLTLLWTTLGNIILAEGVNASRMQLFLSLGAGLLNFLACVALVPALGVKGVPIAFIIAYSAMIGGLWLVKDSYLPPKADKTNGAPLP
ncbi:MAG: oligosaccharide flippase family protein [Elusimicrobia bacterium]|nr:oligosaccharide flippase family protein [Elusimicrobiota bacterium]